MIGVTGLIHGAIQSHHRLSDGSLMKEKLAIRMSDCAKKCMAQVLDD